jgi:O-antigen biosynthesis protein
MLGRVVVDGVHLALDGAMYRVRGATYGSFIPRFDGQLYPERAVVKQDFATMAEIGLNTVRTYTLPPIDIIEIAEDHGLRLLVGIQYADWRMEPRPGRTARRRVLDAGQRAVDEALESCSGNPNVLAVAVGNEAPADLVRLHGVGAVTEVLGDLIGRIHDADPDLPVTYVNFPTTEFLPIEGQDIVCFNVFLERPAAMRRYLRHLRVLAGDRPLVISELGLAADLHGADAQAEALDWQLRLVDETGCAGATVFSWTDEWGVDGESVDGWGFGMTDAERSPKPALAVAHRWATSPLREARPEWPSVTVVICAYNEEATLAECLASVARCDYPRLEVIVCDDGSTDRTAEIVSRFPFRLLRLPHRGLSVARNAGLAAASSDIVAYLDADAACHAEWPYHLALSLDDPGVVATGGPNLPFETSPFVERAVAQAPGGPVEVLVSDDRAEHVPGCNMAFQREQLLAIGGFDEAYTAAGDDVDVCWKLLDRGGEIAFTPAAQVRHHRRRTVRGYLGQQRGYGRAERMLSGAHPHRFNRLGQARWSGAIYGGTPLFPRLLRPVVYHGYMGLAPFQSVTRRPAEMASVWVSALLPLSLALPVAGVLLAPISAWWLLLVAAPIVAAAGYALGVALWTAPPRREPRRAALRLLIGLLHALQPFARTWGRLRGKPLPPVAPQAGTWSGDRAEWLQGLMRHLSAHHCRVRPAHPHQSWDLAIAAGPFLMARLTTAVLWHWEPAAALTLRPRFLLLPVAAGLMLATTRSAALALVAALALAVALTSEGFLLRSRLRTALRATTPPAAGSRGGTGAIDE